jgi:hypothetical protein
MEKEPLIDQRYPALAKSDEELLQEIFTILSSKVNGNPYGDDSEFASAIRLLPLGLRAMAATHWLDISLTLDNIGWHFLNFGEPDFVKETHLGLRELGLDDLAGWFIEAYEIVEPLKAEIRESEEYDETLRDHGVLDRMDELSKLAWDQDGSDRKPSRSAIYDSWVRYARSHPDRVFAG